MFRFAPEGMEDGTTPDELDPTYSQDESMADAGPEMMMDQPESDPNKLDQSVVVYMTSEYGPFECQNCKYWVDPNACSVVSGEIDPKGCCNVYTPPDQAANMEAEPATEEVTEPTEEPVTEEEPVEPEMGG